jgi:hypothetical protein
MLTDKQMQTGRQIQTDRQMLTGRQMQIGKQIGRQADRQTGRKEPLLYIKII